MPANEYLLPDVGEGLTEAEIVAWKVKVGDVVQVNDIVVEIETAKSLVELPSPYAGTVQELLVPEGETVPVGTPIIRIGDGEAGPADGGSDQPAEIDLSNPAATGGGENQTLVGYGPRDVAPLRRARKGHASPRTEAGASALMQVQGAFTPGGAQSQPVMDAPEEPELRHPRTPRDPASHPGHTPAGASGRVLAKPPVRRLAKDLGVDLASVTPTGPGGTVTRADVEDAAAGTTSAAPSQSPARTSGQPGQRGERREPIKGVRKMMGQAMVSSAFSAPHVTEWITVDVTRTMELVDRLKGRRDFAEVKVSPLLVVAKACLLAIRRTPEINSTWDEDAQEIVFKDYVNLGIAAATPRGLVVPNIKDADLLSLRELAEAINAAAATARDGRTSPAEMAGGSFTITNVGVFGVDAGTPIINPGESAILAFGAVRRQPWVVGAGADERLEPRWITTLALSFDHRHVDGERGSRFLADVAAILEDPGLALLH